MPWSHTLALILKFPITYFPTAMISLICQVDTYYGNGVLLNFSENQQRTEISVEQVKIAADKAGGIRQGDIGSFAILDMRIVMGKKAILKAPIFLLPLSNG
ncbi:MAG: hypothetical protein V8S98_03720 [Lachnospiraceae bacterium]